MKQSTIHKVRDAAPFWTLVGFLILVFLTGGGARADIQSLAILRPVSAVVLGYALWGLTRAQVRPLRILVWFAAAILSLVLIHLIPLPPALWGALPGRDLVSEIDRTAGLGAVWRPISLVPSETWNSCYALIVPFAVLALTLRLTRDQRFALLPVLLLLGLASGLIGLLQVIGPNDSLLYLYRITNTGEAVGLFANRNHQAVLLACLFPMLAVYASAGLHSVEQARLRGLLAIGAGVVLIPLLLVTGSRAGLVVGVIGLAAAMWLYRRPLFDAPAKRKIRRIDPRYVIGTVAIMGLGVLTLLMSRAQALDRLLAKDGTEDLRFTLFGPIMRMAGKYFPVGSGVGSFVEVYQVDEPFALLSPDYVNHAHNDWIEVFMTGGLPAAILLAIAITAWGYQSVAVSRAATALNRGISFGRLGAVLIFMLALASAVDYPLRVPSIVSFFVVATVWLATALQTGGGNPRRAQLARGQSVWVSNGNE